MSDNLNQLRESVSLHIGALAPRIKKQLSEQGWHGNRSFISQIQKDVDAIVRLKIRGHVTDSEARKVHCRIMKNLKRGIYRHD